jgi:signal peptidase I
MDKKVIKEIISWVMVFVVAFLLALFINKVLVFKLIIPTGSMIDTINIGDRVFAYRQAYLFKEPEKGDIIIFPFPDDESEDYIKRIIGVPGDVLDIKNGELYINGELIDESDYITGPMNKNESFGPVTVPEDSYFVMGDNRNDSRDSRYWNNKFVKKDKIKGKAIFKYPKFKWLY